MKKEKGKENLEGVKAGSVGQASREGGRKDKKGSKAASDTLGQISSESEHQSSSGFSVQRLCTAV